MRKYLWLAILPLFLYWLGAALNIIVVSANHGVMPVMVPYSWGSTDGIAVEAAGGMILDPRHIAWLSGAVRFAVLADWIVIPSGVCSIGDLFLWLGDWMQPYCIGGWMALSLRDFPAVPRD